MDLGAVFWLLYPANVVYIASAGKWLAEATIAAVVDEGNLSWDDKVVKWLPDWTDAKGRPHSGRCFPILLAIPIIRPTQI